MKKIFHFGVILLVFTFSGQTNAATIIDFDDLATAGEHTKNLCWDTHSIKEYEYHGFLWKNFGVIDGEAAGYANSGYEKGKVSQKYVAYPVRYPVDFTSFKGDLSLSTPDKSKFNFTGAYLTAAWNTDLQITVTGSGDGMELYARTVEVDPYGPTWFDFNFSGIDTLLFHSYGGTWADCGGKGPHFAMDNFTYNIPAPPTLVLLGAGLAGIYATRRKD